MRGRTMILYATRLWLSRPKWRDRNGRTFRSLAYAMQSMPSVLTEDIVFTQIADERTE